MYTSKDIAEAIEKIPADDMTAIAWCDLYDRITRETGLSEEAVRQMMKKECLLWIEKMRQFGEGMLSGKVLAITDDAAEQHGFAKRCDFPEKLAQRVFWRI